MSGPLQRPLFDACQRWRAGRESYRPAGEPIDPARYAVELVEFATAKRFVAASHYSGTMPAARLQVGLYHKPSAVLASRLVGAVVFSVPVQERAVPAWLDGLEPRLGVELGRLVCDDSVPGNGETFFLARAFRLLRASLPEVRGVLSYCDPMERRDADGHIVKRGHVGTVYQAFNGQYRGRTAPRTICVAPNGRCVSERALSKLRRGEQGQDYAERQLRAAGAPARRPGEDGRSYVARALGEGGFHKVRHPGNHTFTWRLW